MERIDGDDKEWLQAVRSNQIEQYEEKKAQEKLASIADFGGEVVQ
jgi:hypothetical protein